MLLQENAEEAKREPINAMERIVRCKGAWSQEPLHESVGTFESRREGGVGIVYLYVIRAEIIYI